MDLEDNEIPSDYTFICWFCLKHFPAGFINIHECFQQYKNINYYINQENICFPMVVDDDDSETGIIPELKKHLNQYESMDVSTDEDLLMDNENVESETSSNTSFDEPEPEPDNHQNHESMPGSHYQQYNHDSLGDFCTIARQEYLTVYNGVNSVLENLDGIENQQVQNLINTINKLWELLNNHIHQEDASRSLHWSYLPRGGKKTQSYQTAGLNNYNKSSYHPITEIVIERHYLMILIAVGAVVLVLNRMYVSESDSGCDSEY